MLYLPNGITESTTRKVVKQLSHDEVNEANHRSFMFVITEAVVVFGIAAEVAIVVEEVVLFDLI